MGEKTGTLVKRCAVPNCENPIREASYYQDYGNWRVCVTHSIQPDAPRQWRTRRSCFDCGVDVRRDQICHDCERKTVLNELYLLLNAEAIKKLRFLIMRRKAEMW